MAADEIAKKRKLLEAQIQSASSIPRTPPHQLINSPSGTFSPPTQVSPTGNPLLSISAKGAYNMEGVPVPMHYWVHNNSLVVLITKMPYMTILFDVDNNGLELKVKLVSTDVPSLEDDTWTLLLPKSLSSITISLTIPAPTDYIFTSLQTAEVTKKQFSKWNGFKFPLTMISKKKEAAFTLD